MLLRDLVPVSEDFRVRLHGPSPVRSHRSRDLVTFAWPDGSVDTMIDRPDGLTVQFEANRRRLRPMACRVLGSHEEAEDAVQEAGLRGRRADAATVENQGGGLTTIVARICLDRLRARRTSGRSPGPRADDALAGTSRRGPEEEAGSPSR